MAASFKPELLPMPVQEIVRNTKEVPDRFIHKNGFPQATLDSVPLMDTLLIDIALISSPSSPSVEAELRKLRSALSSWGCFQVVNHGMTSSFLDEMRHVTKQFFALPFAEKQKYSRKVDDIDGYGNDTIFYEHQTLDWIDRLYLTVYPKNQRKLNFWPEKLSKFSEVIDEYVANLKIMLDVLLKAMARALKLEENCFLNEHGEGSMAARFNLYPTCSTPERVLGAKPHGDRSTITLLLLDKEVEGLQVLKDDNWFKVPVIPHAIFVNAGDLAEIMSNGIIKSAVHRVVTDSERERISLAMFCKPNPNAEIGPLNELINADRPQLYKKVKNYDELFFQHYQLGQRTITAVKL
ncbi:hypothetical protein Nepgr_006417 [Nepenthes gracilis]|uniref:Fe2OG dioxygenase domain-containing protein n=1 Tax=Nepenthes gracilis TaxID=150966 RepID=A0AAD3S5L1_NEPGR|nr:hypothetical protein Nepgr_006417 [Nepenthes gracilis]